MTNLILWQISCLGVILSRLSLGDERDFQAHEPSKSFMGATGAFSYLPRLALLLTGKLSAGLQDLYI